jgi:CRP/FNR family transcriptional regulator
MNHELMRSSVKTVRLFSGINEEDLELLLAIVKVRSCNRGEVLFEDGQYADGFYIVCSGKVKLYKLSPDGKERILHVIPAGESFADAAIFADGSYPAFAESLAVSTLLFIPKREFIALLHSHSQMAINMIAGLSNYLRLFVNQIEDLTFRDVPARLARYLLSLHNGGTSPLLLPISKSQLASNLGTTSETLSRTLRKLSEEGTIRVSGKAIEIIDSGHLYALSNSCGADSSAS